MVNAPAAYSVLVPVYNEASTLSRAVPSLLAAVAGDRAEIVFVCNGCTDGSAALIRQLAGEAVRVIELPSPGKTAALNSGEAHLSCFPRFYLDADITMQPGALRLLAAALDRSGAELVSPRIEFDMTGATRLGRAIAEVWLALPYGRGPAQHLLGISAAGRSKWGLFPELLGDDLFIKAQIPPERRQIVPHVTVVTRPPSRFWTWVRVRARWRRGERQLAGMGLEVVRAPKQATALLRMLCRPRRMVGAAAFILARLLAEPLSRIDDPTWFTDRPPSEV